MAIGLGLITAALSSLKEYASRFVSWVPRMLLDASSRYWLRIKLAYRRKNYVVAALGIIAPLAIAAFIPFDLIDIFLNLTLSFVMIPINALLYLFHTIVYLICWIPTAGLDWIFHSGANLMDGILGGITIGSHHIFPSVSNYVTDLNLLGHLNSFFYGMPTVSISSSLAGSLLVPHAGDMTWRPVTFDINNNVAADEYQLDLNSIWKPTNTYVYQTQNQPVQGANVYHAHDVVDRSLGGGGSSDSSGGGSGPSGDDHSVADTGNSDENSDPTGGNYDAFDYQDSAISHAISSGGDWIHGFSCDPFLSNPLVFLWMYITSAISGLRYFLRKTDQYLAEVSA